MSDELEVESRQLIRILIEATHAEKIRWGSRLSSCHRDDMTWCHETKYKRQIITLAQHHGWRGKLFCLYVGNDRITNSKGWDILFELIDAIDTLESKNRKKETEEKNEGIRTRFFSWFCVAKK